MTQLREQTIRAMQQRGFAQRTHQTYLACIALLAQHFHQSPDQVSLKQLREYFDYLVQEKHLSPSSCRVHLNALVFLYREVLHWSNVDLGIQLPKRHQQIPELLTRQEVIKLIKSCSTLKHRTMLLTCYGCGLRVSELVHLKVKDIDGERQMIRVEQGKGGKDRLVIYPKHLLPHLRTYWQAEHPTTWLFPREHERDQPLSVSAIQKVYTRCKRQVGIQKSGGIHSLRHAYATHQLANGMPLQQLQHQLGHQQLSSTIRYLHWMHSDLSQDNSVPDLIKQLETAI